MELFWGGGGAVLPGAAEPSAESFACDAFGFIGFEVWPDGGGDLGEWDDLLFQTGEAVAGDAAADEHGVFVGGAADEAEVGVVGATAAIGATGHADEDRVIFEAEFAEDGIEVVEHAGQGAFGLTEAEAAGWQGDAGVSDAASGGHAIGVGDAVFGEDGVDSGFLRGVDVGDDEVGIRGDDEWQAEVTGDFVKGAEVLRALVAIGDPAHADVHGAEEAAIALLEPTEIVFHGCEVQWLGGEGFDSRQAADDFGAESVDSHAFHRIFHAGIFAFGAVAMVTLGGHDRLGGIDHVGAPHIQERLRQKRPGAELAMAHAKAAAHRQRVSIHLPVDYMRDKTQVLRENIHIILRLDGNADLKFPRQIQCPVNGITRFGGIGSDRAGAHGVVHIDRGPVQINFFPVQPDVGIGRTAPEKTLADFFTEPLRIGVDLVGNRRGWPHRVAHDVATRPHRGQSTAGNPLDHGLQVALQNTMKLNALAVRQAQCAFR